MPNKTAKRGVILRTLKMLFGYFPRLAPVITFGLIFSSVVSSVPALFQQRIIAVIE